MQRLQIAPGKNRTIHSLMESAFPPLKSTNNKPTPYVTPKTISYIHGLICDSITMFHSDACNARALRNEMMVLEVLEKKEPAIFRQELFITLDHFYEEILGLHGAGGRPKPKSFKRKMKSVMELPAPAETAGSVSAEPAPEEQPAPTNGGGGAEPPAAPAVCGRGSKPAANKPS